ncbi:nucleotidyl transferase AbiEii/AbiGii toxin family protein [Chitinophaga sp. Cy-1792]|uniref:nucleotidyl transferase AbiEii/AbiGii toxin family protein n=1 Tax=Chitinophaga sp. Cy-1792 TaxID=2608339 RepID=UPI001422897E|nr:nucleotidyl transferase AbiEii/AbiGii toxin family protein [Chitinophaga sp. Cy-1792]NIG56756.1 nucleotidyl transferase AbiEii/AbiGii toxin family protein [Chitinophaga sp. Cy-1792]
MLRKETVRESTLELLKKLMQDDILKDFFLAGGTALSLQIGHRISIDLDFFTAAPFNENELLTELENNYSFQVDFQSKNTIKGWIQDVKVDLIAHVYPTVNPIIVEENVRMASLKDIAAMKLNAITGNGTRLKDFIDIAYLSSFLTLSDMVEAYCEKYASRNPVMVLKALDYHNDIDFNEPIIMLDGDYSWQKIKDRLNQMALHPQKLFNKI